MFQINPGKNIATKIGLIPKLGKDRKEIATVLLVFIPEIAIKISYGCHSYLALGYDTFDDAGTMIA
jgi:hypothetical protein